MGSPGDPCGGSNFVNVSSIFVGGEIGGFEGVEVDNGVGTRVDVRIGVGVDVGDALSLAAEEVGDDSASGEIAFCGGDVALIVGDFAVFAGVGVTVGDLRGIDGDVFIFALAIGRGLGV